MSNMFLNENGTDTFWPIQKGKFLFQALATVHLVRFLQNQISHIYLILNILCIENPSEFFLKSNA